MNKWLATTALAVGMAALPGVANAEQGQYVKFFGGVSTFDDVESTFYGYDAELTSETGYVVGGAVGASFDDFDIEIEASFRTAELDELNFLSYSYDAEGDVKTLSFMVNGWYNVPLGETFSIYGGGGFGVSQGEATFYGYDEDFSGELTWQAGAGVEFHTESGYTFGLGYRYFNIPNVGDDGIVSNDFMAVVSKRF